MARLAGLDASNSRSPIAEDVIHVNLLLPAERAEALIAMSRRRQQSVGQILRNLIDREIASEA
jgi:uncharacterized protein with PIN domain